MKYLNRSFIAIFVGSLVFASCDKKLDITPRQSVNSETALSTSANIEASITGIYGGLRAESQYGRNKLALSDALADIATATNKSGRLIPENRNTQNAHFTHWTSSYNLLNQINMTLEAIPLVNDAPSAATVQRWVGELKFLRALLHHDLAKAYAYDTTAVVAANYRGNIVLATKAITTPEDAINHRPRRASTKEVYDSIYADLNVAIANLSNSNRGVYFASKGAAHSLFSRVALHYGDYTRVIAEADSALKKITGLATLSDSASYIPGWRRLQNPESIFEVRFNIQAESLGVNVSLQTSYTTLNVLGDPCRTGGFGDLVPNSFLMTNLGIMAGTAPTCSGATVTNPGVVNRSSDVRGHLYEWGTAGRGTRFIETTKFFGKSGFPNLDNVPVIRVPEIYLNRAEAYARRGAAGDEVLALADLNTIRRARGLPVFAGTGTALIDEIMRQRMLEFAFEGMRWFDLKRNGLNVVKSPATIPFNDTRILAPIPQSQIDATGIPQNPGY